MDDRSIVIYCLLTLYHHKENWYKWKKNLFQISTSKILGSEKALCWQGVWNDVLAVRNCWMPCLVATNKSHIRTNNTAKYSFFSCFFFLFFVKTYWEKEKKRKLEIHTSSKSLKLKQYLEPLMRKHGGIGVIYTMRSSSLICNVHQILYNNALTKGKRRLAVQRNPNATWSLESRGWESNKAWEAVPHSV